HLQSNGSVPLAIEPATPFADGRFPTASGKVELYSESLASEGVDPLPGSFVLDSDALPARGTGQRDASLALNLLTGAAHHFVSSSLASQQGLLKEEGAPFVEIHPDDAARRGIAQGDEVWV